MHVYRWLNSDRAAQKATEKQLQSLPEVTSKKHWTKKIHPGRLDPWTPGGEGADDAKGISTFGEKPSSVGPEHLKELVDHALAIVPSDAQSETPVFLLATAGMRLLPDEQRDAVLDETCAYLRSETTLLLPDCDQHIQVISGETEGLYGWIAANYLLGSFDAPAEHAHGKGHYTYGFLDMGGASAQIAFAPNATEAERHAEDLKLVRFRNVGGDVSEHKVFVTTWLEFGANEARRRYVELLLGKYGKARGELPDPCLPKDLRISTKGDILTPDTVDGRRLQLVGTGQWDACLEATFPLLNKHKPCADAPCLLNGVHVPRIDFDVNHFVGVSEYWHTTHEIFEMAHRDKAYDFATYQARVREFCTQPWADVAKGVEGQKWGKKVTASTAAEACFKASWIVNVLHEGIGVPRVGLESSSPSSSASTTHNATKAILDSADKGGFTDAFQAVNKIHDTEVSWTLGRAVLYASSEIPPAAASLNASSASSHPSNTLPVGFGSNRLGAADFQYAGASHPPRPSAGTGTRPLDAAASEPADPDAWSDALFPAARTPRRVPGLLLFLFIVALAAFLLCGKDRRRRLLHRLRPARPFFRRGPGGRFPGKGSGSVFPPGMLHARRDRAEAREGLLEAGLHDPDDFELGSLAGDGILSPPDLAAPYTDADEAAYFSGGVGGDGRSGRRSGAATPALRTPHHGGAADVGGAFEGGEGAGLSRGVGSGTGLVGLGLGLRNGGGLVGRTESRERLGEEARRGSRRGSPVRSRGW